MKNKKLILGICAVLLLSSVIAPPSFAASSKFIPTNRIDPEKESEPGRDRFPINPGWGIEIPEWVEVPISPSL